MIDHQSRSLINKVVRRVSPAPHEAVRRESDIRRLKEQVAKLENQLANINVTSLLIHAENVVTLKDDIEKIKSALMTNKKLAVLLS